MLMIQERNNLVSPVASVYTAGYFKLFSGPSVALMLVCCSAPLIRPCHVLALKNFKKRCQLIAPMLPPMLFLFQLKWKCKKDDETNGGYSRDLLLKLLQKVNVL